MLERGSKTSTVPAVWATVGNFSADAIQMISCRARLVTMEEMWLCHYDPETNQQSMVWRHNSSPRPKKFRLQKSAVKVLDFLWSRRHPPHWLSPKGPNYQRGVLRISAGATERYFEGKTPWEFHQGGGLLKRQCPGSSCICNPEETGLLGLPVSWSLNLLSGSGPVGLPPVPWTEKLLKGRHFASVAEVIAAAETWLDGQLSKFLLCGLQKLEQRAKKCIELRGEYVEQIPSLVVVACFLPSRAKDLSAPPRTIVGYDQQMPFINSSWHT